MRAFAKLREVMATHKDLAHKIEALERKYAGHDEEIQVIARRKNKIAAARSAFSCAPVSAPP